MSLKKPKVINSGKPPGNLRNLTKGIFITSDKRSFVLSSAALWSNNFIFSEYGKTLLHFKSEFITRELAITGIDKGLDFSVIALAAWLVVKNWRESAD